MLTQGEKLVKASQSAVTSPKIPRVAVLRPNMITTNASSSLIASLQTKIQLLTCECEGNKKLLNKMKEGDLSMYTIEKFFETHNPPGISCIGWNLIKEMIQNSFKKANGKRYSTETKEVGFILNSKSANAYRTLCNYLPFPSLNSIKAQFLDEEKSIEKTMLDFTKIKSYVDEYVSLYCKDRDVINATLAVDAISINPQNINEFKKAIGSVSTALIKQVDFYKNNLSEIQKVEFEKAFDAEPGTNESKPATINSLFVFYLEPHDPVLPCIPVHLFLKSGGSANKAIRTLVDQVIDEIQKIRKFELKTFLQMEIQDIRKCMMMLTKRC